MFFRYIINNIILTSIFLWYNNHLFQRKRKWSYLNSLFIIFILVIKSLLNLFLSPQINLCSSILVYLIISISYFDSSVIKRFVFIGFYICSSFICEINIYLLLNYVLNLYKINLNIWIYNLIGSTLSALGLWCIVYLVAKIKDIKELADSKGIWYLIILPITSILIISSIIYFEILSINPILVFLLTLGIIIYNLVICIGFTDILKSKNILIENERLKNQELHYKLLEEKFNSSRHFIHDFKKHINLINEFISNSNYSELNEYISEINDEIRVDENFVITGNQLIDLILNSNNQTLQQYDICVKHDVRVKEIDTIKSIDFNIVFSNLLENAIEHCIRDDGHFIKIKFDNLNGLLVLKVLNPCHQHNSNLKTVKKDKDYHGLGILNVKRIAHKYKGYATFYYDDEYKIFTSTVIFNTQSKSKIS